MVKNMCFIYPYRQIYGIFTLGFINHANPFKKGQMKTIYEKLGEERLKQMVNAFYERVFGNPVIGGLFKNSEPDLVKDKQYCFLTQYLGGPQLYFEKYGSPKMRKRHAAHKIDDAARDEWLKLMKEAIWTLDWDDENKQVLYNCFPTLASHMQNH
jgi:hemoglobin